MDTDEEQIEPLFWSEMQSPRYWDFLHDLARFIGFPRFARIHKRRKKKQRVSTPPPPVVRHDPSLEEIAEVCLEIQSEWTDEDRERRNAYRVLPVSVPGDV